MSRTELESLRDTINSNREEGSPEIPFVILAAMQHLTQTWLPISNSAFSVMLNYIIADRSNVRLFNIQPWLDSENIKGCCEFTVNNRRIVLFLTETQYSILLSILCLPHDSEFLSKSTDILNDANLQYDALTEEELADPLIKEYSIEENSGSINVSENTSRFSSAIWFEEIKKKTVILAGLGGIGSYVCFLLARMQPTSIFLYDDDIVEAANMSGQLYGMSDIDQYKVTAIANMVENYANYNSVFAIKERFTTSCEAADIMICGFDNMVARRTFFNSWLNHVTNDIEANQRSKCLFIDGRLSAEYFQVYCITGDDAINTSKYLNTCLFSDDEADETVCSYKQTTYMANMIGSIMVNLFTNFVANEVAGAPIRELPFLTTYDGNSMQFKIE